MLSKANSCASSETAAASPPNFQAKSPRCTFVRSIRSPAGRPHVPRAKISIGCSRVASSRDLDEANDHGIVGPQAAVREHEIAGAAVRAVERREGPKYRCGRRRETDIGEAVSVIAPIGVGVVGRFEHPAVVPVHLHCRDSQRDAASRVDLFKGLASEGCLEHLAERLGTRGQRGRSGEQLGHDGKAEASW